MAWGGRALKKSYGFWLLTAICAAMVCPESDGKTRQAPAGATLCIHLYNLAGVPREISEHATLRVSRALAQAGIKTNWEQPPSDSDEAHVTDLNDSAGSFFSGERSCLVVKMVPDVPSGSYAGALGFALPRSRSGIHIELIYRRIEMQAQITGVRTEIVLAYVMAHEIGHVLLQSSKHSSSGIMRAKADEETWRVASCGSMEFLADEARQMREGLLRSKQPIAAWNSSGLRRSVRRSNTATDVREPAGR
jgi:hypothetical protein